MIEASKNVRPHFCQNFGKNLAEMGFIKNPAHFSSDFYIVFLIDLFF